MLQIKQNMEVSFRKKETLFTLNFWKALALAFILHMAFCLIFRIAPLPNLEAFRPLLPADVEIDLVEKTLVVLPHSNDVQPPIEKLERVDYFEKCLEHTFNKFNVETYALKKMEIPYPNFLEIEHIVYRPLEDFEKLTGQNPNVEWK